MSLKSLYRGPRTPFLSVFGFCRLLDIDVEDNWRGSPALTGNDVERVVVACGDGALLCLLYLALALLRTGTRELAALLGSRASENTIRNGNVNDTTIILDGHVRLACRSASMCICGHPRLCACAQ